MLFLARNSITLSHEDFKEVKDYLTNFYWRGNIRQFFKVLASWVAICDFQELPLIAKHIPVNKLMTSQGPSHAVAIDPSNLYLHVPGVFPLVDGDFNLAVEAFEKALLKAAMERHKSPNASAAALKLPRSTFDSKRNKYNLSF
ncbi:MAG: hypothetical protein EOP06_06595 [Proteobacteria bacterium]|nr:MAG: hypothetical protein EOP06_06595 [Pseudomonadota bacterium]